MKAKFVAKKPIALLITLAIAITMLFSVPVSATETEYVPQYRMYNKHTGEHFYTTSVKERNSLIIGGWNYEGVNCLIPTVSDVPMYRLYNKGNGDHHYTTSTRERDVCVQNGWTYEGIGWYSGGDTPIYRLYSPGHKGPGAHHYTSSITERDHLVKNGWNYEGIGWYGISAAGFVDSNPIPDPVAPPIPPAPQQPTDNQSSNNTATSQQSTNIDGLSKPGDKIENPRPDQVPAEARAAVESQYNRILRETNGWSGSGITYNVIKLNNKVNLDGQYYAIDWSATFTKGDTVAEFSKASTTTDSPESPSLTFSSDWEITSSNSWEVAEGYSTWFISYFISAMNKY